MKKYYIFILVLGLVTNNLSAVDWNSLSPAERSLARDTNDSYCHPVLQACAMMTGAWLLVVVGNELQKDAAQKTHNDNKSITCQPSENHLIKKKE